MSHLETLRNIIADSSPMPYSVDDDLRAEAGTDETVALLLQAARMLDERAEDTATLAAEQRD